MPLRNYTLTHCVSICWCHRFFSKYILEMHIQCWQSPHVSYDWTPDLCLFINCNDFQKLTPKDCCRRTHTLYTDVPTRSSSSTVAHRCTINILLSDSRSLMNIAGFRRLSVVLIFVPFLSQLAFSATHFGSLCTHNIYVKHSSHLHLCGSWVFNPKYIVSSVDQCSAISLSTLSGNAHAWPWSFTFPVF